VKKIAIAILMTLLAACGRHGNEYLGKWQTADGKHSVEISANSENLLLKFTDPAYKGFLVSQPGTTNSTTLSGTVKDGLLKVDAPLGTGTMTYVKERDVLLAPGFISDNDEYKRVK
jgi:hypothetical protein